MQLKRVRSIRSSLIGLVVVSLVPVVLMMAWLLWDNSRQKEAELKQESLVNARNISAIVDREFVAVEQALFALASSPLLRNPDLSGFYAQSQAVVESTGLSAITLLDAEITPLLHTRLPYGKVQIRPAYREHTEQVVKTGKTVTSAMFMGPVVKQYVIQIAVPVSDGRTVTHVLVGVLLADHFQKILEKYNLTSGQIVAIFDRSEAVVALVGATQTIDQVRSRKVNPGTVKALSTADEGTLETINLQGQQILTAFSRSPSSRWGASIAIPRKSITAELWQSVWLLIAVSVLSLGASLAAAWAVGGKIAGAVQTLRELANNMGARSVVALPERPMAVREAQEVAQAMVKACETMTASSASLVTSEARMRSILQSAMDAIITVDAAYQIMLFNPAAAGMFGYSAAQAQGMRLQEMLVGWTDSMHEFSGLATGLRSGGQTFPVELTVSMTQEAHAPLYTLIIRDVSGQVQARTALERSNRDLKQFAFVASHDLKTPLRSIGGFVQLLAKNNADVFDAKSTALVDRTLTAVRRLEQLTDDLLGYAQIDTAARELLPVDMADVAREVVSLLNASIEQTGGVVTLDALPTVMGDRTQLVQLLLNLVGNGLKYCTGHAPLVRLGAHRQDGGWVFFVLDNGIGIDAKHHEKVFEVFKRLHSQSEFPGTGIGLAVCRRIVDAHGGRIWVTSESGAGSTFSFTLTAIKHGVL